MSLKTRIKKKLSGAERRRRRLEIEMEEAQRRLVRAYRAERDGTSANMLLACGEVNDLYGKSVEVDGVAYDIAKARRLLRNGRCGRTFCLRCGGRRERPRKLLVKIAARLKNEPRTMIRILWLTIPRAMLPVTAGVADAHVAVSQAMKLLLNRNDGTWDSAFRAAVLFAEPTFKGGWPNVHVNVTALRAGKGLSQVRAERAVVARWKQLTGGTAKIETVRTTAKQVLDYGSKGFKPRDWEKIPLLHATVDDMRGLICLSQRKAQWEWTTGEWAHLMRRTPSLTKREGYPRREAKTVAEARDLIRRRTTVPAVGHIITKEGEVLQATAVWLRPRRNLREVVERAAARAARPKGS